MFQELEKELTADLKAREAAVLARASAILGRNVNVASLHGIIGGKNNVYTDAIHMAFPSPDVFIASWYRGLLEQVEAIEMMQSSKYAGNIYQNTTQHGHLRLVRDPLVKEYFEIFLTRNFYRQFEARTRIKPKESHVALWFGENQMPWGLLIAPAFRSGDWVNDVSEIRRAPYAYWTIGHVLSTGLIDPSSSKIMHFVDLQTFLIFCDSVLKRMTTSKYEHAIWDRYILHLGASASPESVPFLVPELRYAGRAEKHKYRLDFTVLNAHTQDFVGFELSPQSTHMKVAGSNKTLKAHNEDLRAKWSHESEKRNEYFADYGISVLTYTDDHLGDIDKCFEMFVYYLDRRVGPQSILHVQRSRIDNFVFETG